MNKKILAIVTLLCAIPLLAHAWQLNTWVKSPGGAIIVTKTAPGTQPANAINYRSTNGSTFKNYTTTTNPTVTITPDAGYMINTLQVNAVPVNAAVGQIVPTAAVLGANGIKQTIYASFVRQQLTFNVTAGTNGIVSPAGLQRNMYVGAQNRTYTFVPARGYKITGITTTGGPVTFTNTTLNVLNQKVVVTVSNVAANATLSATYVSSGTPAVPATGATAGRNCDACHIAQGLDPAAAVIFLPWSSSVHNMNAFQKVGCANCHNGADQGAHPGQVQCSSCHATWTVATPSADFSQCAGCHTGSTPHSLQAVGATFAAADCVACHDVYAPQHANSLVGIVIGNEDLVNAGNIGVRAIVQDFSKKSHHIVNAANFLGAPTKAQCIMCHAEGKNVGGVVTIDTNFHMKDGKIYLRNGGGVGAGQLAKELGGNKSTTVSSVSVFAWDPANPNHNLMDQFCFSCHNANGAPTAFTANSSALRATAGLTVTNATNPFADKLANSYDQMVRPAVVNVFNQFSSTNASHHAVRAKKYSTRTKPAGASAFTTYSGATYPGSRQTIYQAGLFVSTYTPLGAAQTVGDDSVLHCGDCHTVGQWAPGSTTDASGTPTTTVIGAHGSNNEYMLRTSTGIDQLHTQTAANVATGGTYVCFLCHTPDKSTVNGKTYGGYGDLGGAGVTQHAGLHTGGSGCNARLLESVGKVGTARVGGAASTATASATIFGFSCSNCHNSGNRVFGGIHGGNGGAGGGFESYSTTATTTGAGNTFTVVSPKPYRFMGGVGLKYQGGGSKDKWESATLNGAHREGCYNIATANVAPSNDGMHFWSNNPPAGAEAGTVQNLGGTVGTGVLGSWGACGHHIGTTSLTTTAPTRSLQRPLSY